MTLKDWKKTDNQKNSFGYKHKKEDNYYILFYKHSSFNPPFRLVIHRHGRVIEDEQYSTKYQAISFAKSYMRTH